MQRMLRAALATLLVNIGWLSAASLTPVGDPTPIQRDTSGQPVPRYSNGYYYGYDSSRLGFWVENVDGYTVVEKRLGLPGAAAVSIRDMAVSAEGAIALSASAKDAEGRLADVLVWVRPDGSTERIVRTTPYAAQDILFASDGSLWAVGRERAEGSLDEASHYDLLRRFDHEGRQTRSFLSHDGGEFQRDHPLTRCFLTTAGDDVAFISRSAGSWVILSAAGVVEQGEFEWPAALEATGVAATSSGRVLASAQPINPAGPDEPVFPVLELDKKTGEWAVVASDTAIPIDSAPLLLGAEGERVFARIKAGPAAFAQGAPIARLARFELQ